MPTVALGERVAISILKEQSGDYHEDWFARFTKFAGALVEIRAHAKFEV
ncbi:MAG TPA: hypothetical protein VMN36_11965 [Verrucomicrobiales bacterium]|nr:hypothetical protein [Verrucomicrobiales bacterium]